VLEPLLDSPYPTVRAAAMRVILGGGGKPAEAAAGKTATDRSPAVQAVQQQFRFTPPPSKPKWKPLPPPPADPADRKTPVARMLDEFPGFEKRSAWEEMVWRADTLAAWSRAERRDQGLPHG
jgi:hypothetical protein